ncbi:hypothetical protein ATANTOWER_012223 [Ataeniobius toweri]|uniref:Uncharacterized protein n=1 Tax=Ataeniobius toweri TaxID=208326 RepID=A0ABU7CJK3_9TELE|nr:hypothetical protein [Ataeniobius toweri]
MRHINNCLVYSKLFKIYIIIHSQLFDCCDPHFCFFDCSTSQAVYKSPSHIWLLRKTLRNNQMSLSVSSSGPTLPAGSLCLNKIFLLVFSRTILRAGLAGKLQSIVIFCFFQLLVLACSLSSVQESGQYG